MGVQVKTVIFDLPLEHPNSVVKILDFPGKILEKMLYSIEFSLNYVISGRVWKT